MSELHFFMEQKLRDRGKTLKEFADWMGMPLDDLTDHISNDNEAFNQVTNDKGLFNVIHNHTQKITGDHNTQNVSAIMNDAAIAYFARVDVLKNKCDNLDTENQFLRKRLQDTELIVDLLLKQA